MNGLTNSQEVALARILMAQDQLPGDFTEWGITADLIALRDCGMLEMHTDASGEFAYVLRLLPLGHSHYQEVRAERRGFVRLRDSADELIGVLVLDCDRNGTDVPAVYFEDRITDYQALDRAGLLKVMWAENKAYYVQVTDAAWQYVEGTFPMEKAVKIENNITNNNVINGVNATADSSASATARSSVTLGVTIQAILDMDIDEQLKERAEASLKELDAAAKAKDKTSFAEKLERAASIAKSASVLAGVMLPFFETAIQRLFS